MLESSRYIRQLGVIGDAGQLALSRAKVLCVGAGGLGVLVCAYLVGMGVGELHIIDGDIIELSNLTRQIIYTEDDCGKSKAQVLVKYLKRLNSEIIIQAYNYFLETKILRDLARDYNLVLDCSDTFTTRYLISDFCNENNIPLISASIDGLNGQIMCFLSDICYRCVFPQTQVNNSCNNGNVIGASVGVIASYQVNEAFKFLVGFNQQNKLIQIDTLDNKTNCYLINIDPDCINAHHGNIPLVNNNIIQYVPYSQINKNPPEKRFILDLNTNSGFTDDISKDTEVIVVCNYGYRAKFMALQLYTRGYTNIYYSCTNI